jgi:uncharacterized protein YebE (UPF0316 family)
LAYAGGFGVDNYIGVWMASRFAIGNERIRYIAFNRDVLAEMIRETKFKVVLIDGDMGNDKPVEVLFIIKKRRNVPTLILLIKALYKTAVYPVPDVKSVYDGVELLPRHRFLAAAKCINNSIVMVIPIVEDPKTGRQNGVVLAHY